MNEVITHSWNRLRRHYGQCRAAAPNLLPDGEAGTGLTNDDRVLSQESYVDIDVRRNSRVMAGCQEERAIQGNPGGCMSTREVVLSQDVSTSGLASQDLTSPRVAGRILRGGFEALRRFIAFFVSGRILIAFRLRPQVGDMREAPDVEFRVAERFARGPVTQACDLVREMRQLCAYRLDHSRNSKAPGDHVGDKVGDLHARGEVAVHEEGSEMMRLA